MHMHFHTRDYALGSFKPCIVQSAIRPKHDATIRARIVGREQTHFWCVFIHSLTHTQVSAVLHCRAVALDRS